MCVCLQACIRATLFVHACIFPVCDRTCFVYVERYSHDEYTYEYKPIKMYTCLCTHTHNNTHATHVSLSPLRMHRAACPVSSCGNCISKSLSSRRRWGRWRDRENTTCALWSAVRRIWYVHVYLCMCLSVCFASHSFCAQDCCLLYTAEQTYFYRTAYNPIHINVNTYARRCGKPGSVALAWRSDAMRSSAPKTCSTGACCMCPTR